MNKNNRYELPMEFQFKEIPNLVLIDIERKNSSIYGTYWRYTLKTKSNNSFDKNFTISLGKYINIDVQGVIFNNIKEHYPELLV